MERRLCSYDMAAVLEPAFVLSDPRGEMSFCGLRCLCLWSVALATRSELPETLKVGTYLLRTAVGEEHHFTGLAAVARRAVNNVLGKQ